MWARRGGPYPPGIGGRHPRLAPRSTSRHPAPSTTYDAPRTRYPAPGSACPPPRAHARTYSLPPRRLTTPRTRDTRTSTLVRGDRGSDGRAGAGNRRCDKMSQDPGRLSRSVTTRPTAQGAKGETGAGGRRVDARHPGSFGGSLGVLSRSLPAGGILSLAALLTLWLHWMYARGEDRGKRRRETERGTTGRGIGRESRIKGG